jgi:hypothetical protein
MEFSYRSKAVFLNSHNALNLTIACSDFRFKAAFEEFLTELKKANTDRIIVPGGHLMLFQKPAGSADCEKASKGWIKLLVAKHRICEVIIIGHEGCAAYADSPKYKNFAPKKLKLLQLRDLKKSAGVIKKMLPKVKVNLYFASPQEGNTVLFNKI